MNESENRPVRLTVAGPSRWPLPGKPPWFVNFRGLASPEEVTRLYASHDLFVMPSRFEAFGVVFAEALAAGVPCIARRAFAMPEIIEDGVTGVLIESDDPDELTAAIERVLGDPGIHQRVAQARSDLLARYSWPAIASSMVNHIRSTLSDGGGQWPHEP